MLEIIDGEDKSSPFKNRIRKNYQHLRKWGKRTNTDCFRIFDRDIKEYPLTIDYYAGHFLIHLVSFNESRDDLLLETVAVLHALFGVPPEKIISRARVRRKKTEQYEKIDSKGGALVVQEYGIKFLINLTDYIDTGLFLDHREIRRYVATMANGKRVLNLFAYTCSFSVHAAAAGARSTTSIDLSNTYTRWGRENFLLDALPEESNSILRADCLKFLDSAGEKEALYDLIIIDPPTISRSKKMDSFFDLQRDYAQLITQALPLLSSQGLLLFSTNSRQFKFDTTLFPSTTIKEITEQTMPADFRNRKIHRCWQIKK